MSRIRPLIAAVVLTGALTATSGCAPAEPAPVVTTASPAAAPAPTPTPSATRTGPVVRPADLTCETLIAPEVAAAFAEAGWTPQEDVFRMGSRELADGLWCMWGAAGADTASLQIYGWAPLDAAEAEEAEEELIDRGWVREDGDGGVYVTENPDTTVATDDDGYGMTFLFRDGWVAVSDTKEGLLVIEPPV